jgi:hypothetical protein
MLACVQWRTALLHHVHRPGQLRSWYLDIAKQVRHRHALLTADQTVWNRSTQEQLVCLACKKL